MTAAAAPVRSTSTPTTDRRPIIAGAAYVGAWVVGLSAFGTGPAVDASDAEIARFFADHRLATSLQALLVHGLAAVALGAVLLAARRRHAVDRTTVVAGAAGVVLSLVQLVLDLWRSAWSTGSTTADLVHAIDRVDGVKMLAFAVMIGAGTAALRRARLVARPMSVVGAAAVVALVLSGAGYVTGSDSLRLTAVASLPLLLLWVCATGVRLGHAAA